MAIDPTLPALIQQAGNIQAQQAGVPLSILADALTGMEKTFKEMDRRQEKLDDATMKLLDMKSRFPQLDVNIDPTTNRPTVRIRPQSELLQEQFALQSIARAEEERDLERLLRTATQGREPLPTAPTTVPGVSSLPPGTTPQAIQGAFNVLSQAVGVPSLQTVGAVAGRQFGVDAPTLPPTTSPQEAPAQQPAAPAGDIDIRRLLADSLLRQRGINVSELLDEPARKQFEQERREFERQQMQAGARAIPRRERAEELELERQEIELQRTRQKAPIEFRQLDLSLQNLELNNELLRRQVEAAGAPPQEAGVASVQGLLLSKLETDSIELDDLDDPDDAKLIKKAVNDVIKESRARGVPASTIGIALNNAISEKLSQGRRDVGWIQKVSGQAGVLKDLNEVTEMISSLIVGRQPE